MSETNISLVCLFKSIIMGSESKREFFGIPKEVIDFSNSARPVFSAPAYTDVKFRLDQSMTTIIELIYSAKG